MPPQIDALPRTAGGIPITYTVAWSSEHGVDLRHDPLLTPLTGRPTLAIFSKGKQGEGSPKLAITDVSRQREVALRGLCRVCGQQLADDQSPPWRPARWVADLRKDGQMVRQGNRTLPLIIDGWTCASCLVYALQVCPGLLAKDWKKSSDRGGLRLLKVRDAQLVATLERPDEIPLSELDEVPVGFVKILPLDFSVVRPNVFLRQYEERIAA